MWQKDLPARSLGAKNQEKVRILFSTTSSVSIYVKFMHCTYWNYFTDESWRVEWKQRE